jgi:hypothetical protein
MCETVQSNVLLLFLGKKKITITMHTQKLAEVFADGGTKKKHAGEKVQKCLKSKQKQIEGNGYSSSAASAVVTVGSWRGGAKRLMSVSD